MWKTKTHTFRLYLVLCLVVFFAALLLPACTPEASTEAPTEAPTEALAEEPTEAPTEEPTETPTEEVVVAPRFFSVGDISQPVDIFFEREYDRFFLPDRILFTGVVTDITQTIDLLQGNLDRVPDTETINRLREDLESLEITGPEWSIDNLLRPSQFQNGDPFSIQQYRVSHPQLNVLEVISKTIVLVGEYEVQTGKRLFVFPEPVYLIGVPSDLNGQSGGGSPGIEGGPGGGSAGIEGGGGDAPWGSAPEYFVYQWALSNKGVNLIDFQAEESQDPLSENRVTGRSVRVAVFDSLPLDQDKCYRNIDIETWMYPFHFCAHNTLGPITTEPGSVNEHGYFVASLIQVVAPESVIDIVQVLQPTSDGKDVVGTVGYLLEMMDSYLKAAEAARASGEVGFNRVVINLSLGLKLNSPQDGAFIGEDFPSVVLEFCNKLQKHENKYRVEIEETSCSPDGPIPSVALKVYIEHVVKVLGHIVVASAGNEWTGEPAVQPSALLPAGLPAVLGVGGSNFGGTQACFSNVGDVYAPGGNGTLTTDEDGTISCKVDVVGQCQNEYPTGSCPDAVIGRVYNTGDTDSSPYSSGFAYWVGTSFSAPMASGLAALVWDVCRGWSQAEVRQLIMDNATEGIIDVQSTVDAPREECALAAQVWEICPTWSQAEVRQLIIDNTIDGIIDAQSTLIAANDAECPAATVTP